MMRVKLVIVALLCVITLIVVLQNTETVETKLLFASIQMPRAVLIGVSFLVGAVTGLLAATKFGGGKKSG